MCNVLSENHGADLLRAEGLLAALVLDSNNGLAILGGDLVGEVLDVRLDILLRELAADETLDVEDSVEGIGGGLVLGGISYKLENRIQSALGMRAKGGGERGQGLGKPTRSSSVKATYDGVIRFPWSLTRISTFPFCMTPTPKSQISLFATRSVEGMGGFCTRVGGAKILVAKCQFQEVS